MHSAAYTGDECHAVGEHHGYGARNAEVSNPPGDWLVHEHFIVWSVQRSVTEILYDLLDRVSGPRIRLNDV